MSPDIQSIDRTTEFDHIYSQILSFIQLWSQKQVEQCNFDLQSFLNALTSYKSTLEENSYLKSSHTSLYKLCDVNIKLFFFFLSLTFLYFNLTINKEITRQNDLDYQQQIENEKKNEWT